MNTNTLNTVLIAGMLILALSSCQKEVIPPADALSNAARHTSAQLLQNRGKHIKDWNDKKRAIVSDLRILRKKKGNGVRT